jgi:hypothetical protein
VTLSASEAAVVTASLASGLSAAIDLPAVSPFTLTIDRPSAILVGGTTFTVQVTPNSAVVSPPAPAAVTMNCGFGSAVDVTGTRSHRCVFPSAGDFMLEATARTANGWTLSERVPVTAVTSATPAAPPSSSTSTLSLSVSAVGGNERRITATASFLVREFRFLFREGGNPPAETQRFDGAGSLTASAQHIYPAGTHKATVRAEPADRSPVVTADIEFTVP